MDASPHTNPLLDHSGLPRFAEILPEHVKPAVDTLVDEVEAALQALEESHEPTWEGLLQPLARINIQIHGVRGAISHLLGVKNSPELRKAHEAILPKIVQLGLRIQQSLPIYKSLKAIRSQENWDNFSNERKRIIEQKLQDAELFGVGLTGETRDRFNTVSKELTQLATQFSNNVLDASKAFSLTLTQPEQVDGIPKPFLAQYAQSYNNNKDGADVEATPEQGPWRITLDYPSMRPFLQHAKARELREKIYRARLTIASKDPQNNTKLIDQILRLRQEKARILGFQSFADLSLSQKMADSVNDVERLLKELRLASKAPAVRELEELNAFAKEQGAETPLQHWDIGFWAERYREQKFQFTDAELRPYFAFPRVLQGLFSLIQRLFGVTIHDDSENAPVWHKDVRYYTIHNEQNEHIAGFYLDPYSRPENKRSGAWMDECRNRCLLDGKLQLPVAYLVCNSTPPVGETPSLMSFREVETLFHEFGHGLQHMLTKVDELDVSGINGVEWDAVELPSQFMENWCYHKPTLQGMAVHYTTGQVIPDELFEKLCAARTYRAGWQMLRQLHFGFTDLHLHHRYQPDADTNVFQVEREIALETLPLQPLAEDRFLCAFSHIFAGGYAAGYYSYKWAEVLSADAFNAFEEAGLDNEEAIQAMGRRFRDTVLSLGGGLHPMEVFRQFRGREPSTQALLRHNGLLPASR